LSLVIAIILTGSVLFCKQRVQSCPSHGGTFLCANIGQPSVPSADTWELRELEIGNSIVEFQVRIPKFIGARVTLTIKS